MSSNFNFVGIGRNNQCDRRFRRNAGSDSETSSDEDSSGGETRHQERRRRRRHRHDRDRRHRRRRRRRSGTTEGTNTVRLFPPAPPFCFGPERWANQARGQAGAIQEAASPYPRRDATVRFHVGARGRTPS